MAQRIFVPRLSWAEHFVSELVNSLIRLITKTEKSTYFMWHVWNSVRLLPHEVERFTQSIMIPCAGCLERSDRSHTQVEYIIISPCEETELWYLGWISETHTGVSRLPWYGSMQLVLQPGNTTLFGINLEGEQIFLYEVTRGYTVTRMTHSQVPLR